MKFKNALLAGAAGATALTLVHEGTRQIVSTAPRVDIIGRKLVSYAFYQTGNAAPDKEKHYAIAMMGDLVSNALYYSLVGWGRSSSALTKGLWLGVGGGVAAVVAPQYLDLPEEPVSRESSTTLMTIGWYTLGGVVTGWVAQRIGES